MFRVPGFALRLALGELADTLLTGQRAVPERAGHLGFQFRFPDIAPALGDVIS
jgi:NAD dependent epimerase/dehydratase family enzyme